LPSPEKSTPKTFYFGMDGALQNDSRDCVDQHMEQIQSRLQAKEINGSIDCLDYTDDVSNVFYNIFRRKLDSVIHTDSIILSFIQILII